MDFQSGAPKNSTTFITLFNLLVLSKTLKEGGGFQFFTWLMMTGAEWPRGWTLKPGDRVPDSGSGSNPNTGGDPTRLAAVGGGRKVSSRELWTSIPEMRNTEYSNLVWMTT